MSCSAQLTSRDSVEELMPYTVYSGLKVCLDAAKGMSYVHSVGLIHRDLKSRNIMIADELQGKVADYGESRENIESTMTSTGTPFWMAPEVAKSEHYDSKADVFSFGVILYEACKRELPYKDQKAKPVTVAAMVALDRLRPNIEEEWHPGVKSLMRDCYQTNPINRPSFPELVPRLINVIHELGAIDGAEQSGEKIEAMNKDGAKKEVSKNFVGLNLWRKIQVDPNHIHTGQVIGKVRPRLFAVLFPICIDFISVTFAARRLT